MGKHIKVLIAAAVVLAVCVGVLAVIFLQDGVGKNDVLVGLQSANGESYYYDADGVQQYGWHTIDGKLYYFDPDSGAAKRGWFTDGDGSTYYFGAEGWAVTGEQVIDGEVYTFDVNGRLIASDGSNSFTWEEKDGKFYCKDAGGEYLTGLQKIDGVYYYFDDDGARQSGLQTLDGKIYYFSPDTGRAAKGWMTIDGDTYYFGAEGNALTGRHTIDGKSQEFDDDGKLIPDNKASGQAGSKKTPASSSSSVPTTPAEETPAITPSPATPSPDQPVMQGQWVTKDGKVYFQDADGSYKKGIVDTDDGRFFCDPQTGERKTGLIVYNNQTYYFDETTGKAISGWKNDPNNTGNIYYFDAYGQAVKGLQVLQDGKRYFFDAKTGIRQSGLRTVSGKLYYFAGSNDSAVSGWYTIGQNVPEANSVGAASANAVDEQEQSGKTYYFGDNYFALTGLQKIPDENGDVAWFQFGEDGAREYGFYPKDAPRYYFDPQTGKAHVNEWIDFPGDPDARTYLGNEGAFSTGITDIGDKKYCFDSDGKQLKGWVSAGTELYCFEGPEHSAIVNDWKTNNEGDRFYLGEDGVAYVGVHEILGDIYGFSGSGTMLTSWQDLNEGVYNFGEDGKALKSQWINRDTKTYFLGGKGSALTGVQSLTGPGGQKGVFYFNPETAVQENGWATFDGKKYLFEGTDGAAVTGQYSDGFNNYLFGEDGAAKSGVQQGEDGYLYYYDANTYLRKAGWQKSGGANHYFDPQTGRAVTGWFTDVSAKAIFYFNSNGQALTGSQNINERDYRFDENGRLMPDGTEEDGNWVENNGYTYYVDATGSFVTGLQVIDNAVYFFAADGKMQYGWVNHDNNRYFFIEPGEGVTNAGQAVFGWYPGDSDRQYYFGEDGAAYTGVQFVGTDRYCFAADGTIRDGVITEGGKTYFFDPAKGGKAYGGWYPDAKTTGAKYYDTASYEMAAGKTTIDGKLYLFNEQGERQRTWHRDGNGQLYAFFGENDAAITGAFYQNDEGQKYYLTAEGPALIGLRQIGTGGTGEENADWYLFDTDGLMQTGFKTYEGNLYYFDPTSGKALKGEKLLEGSTYYFDDDYAHAQTGLFLKNGYTYVFGPDGKMISRRATEGHAWKTGDDGRLHYTNSAGEPIGVGLVLLDGHYYMFDSEGGILTGWQNWTNEEDGKTYKYFFGNDGKAYIGWYTEGAGESQKSYYFDEEGRALVSVSVNMNEKDYEFDADGVLTKGTVPIFNTWIEVEAGKWTYHDSTGEPAKGPKTIGEKTYFFDLTTGVQVTGWQMNGLDRYYFDTESGTGENNGTAYTGWRDVGGKYYAFGNDGKQQLKWQIREVDGTTAYTYYFYDEMDVEGKPYGESPVGMVDIGGLRRYFFEDGHMATGWQELPDGKYYFFTNGEMATGVVTIDKVMYSFGADGKAATGWNKSADGKQYYFTDGQPVSGWVEIDYRWYYFDESENYQKIGWQKRPTGDGKTLQYYYNNDGTLPDAGPGVVNGVERYIHPDGHMAVGWEMLDGKVYYFDYQGKKVTGHTTVGKIFYPFAEDGALSTGWYAAENRDRYYYTAEGAVTGWYYLVASGTDAEVQQSEAEATQGVWYAFNSQTATQLKGWQTRTDEDGGSHRHYYDDEGTAAIGWTTFDNMRRYFLPDGEMATGWQTAPAYDTGEESLYYFLPQTGEMATGLVLIDGAQYSFGANGQIQRGWNRNSDGERYYITEEGALTGWQLLDGKWYHLDEATGVQQLGWQGRFENPVTYFHYFFEDGSTAASGWTDAVEKTNRYVLEDGTMARGPMTIGNERYLFTDKGVPQTGWNLYQGKWYVFDTDGKQLTGWQDRKLESGYVSTYYFNADGTTPATGWNSAIENTRRYILEDGEMARGWKTISSYRYYFGERGVPLTGQQTIDGKKYGFDSQGRLVASPVISGVTYETGTAAQKNVTIKAAANSLLTDKTLLYSFDAGKTWATLKSKKFNAGVTIAANTLQVKDSVGNISKYGTAIKLDAAKTTMHGIDVSKFQGYIDWAAVKASGKVDFAIIRSLCWDSAKGYYGIDPYFNYNVRTAKAYGIKVGTYLYSYAFKESEMLEEVNYFMNSAEIKGLQRDGINFDLPVYIDYEDPLITKNTANMSITARTNIVRYGMVLIEQLSKKTNTRYTAGFYVNKNWAENVIDGRALQNEGYPLWLARWGPVAHGWSPAPQMWQYNNGTYTRAEYYHGTTVPGISGRVDMNWLYNAPASSGSSTSTSGSSPGTVAGADYVTSVTSGGKVVTGYASSIIAQIVEAEVGGFGNAEVYKAQAVAAQSWIKDQQSKGYAAPSVVLKTPSSAVTSAVKQVLGEYVTYGGKVAMTPYFAYGNGMTNDAKYWNAGNNYPYLVPVRSDYDATVKSAYTGTIPEAKLKERLTAIYGYDVTAGYAPQDWIKVTGRNAGGYITSLNVCGRTPKTEYFYLTMLPYSSGGKTVYPVGSPDFTVSYSGGVFTFTTRGYGHCIGMSQHGAYGLALQGYNYKQILSHFYPGTTTSLL